jgi:hypothetical protein
MGLKTEAFDLLEVAYHERLPWLVFLALYPSLSNIRADARYANLLRRMGLPQTPLQRTS